MKIALTLALPAALSLAVLCAPVTAVAASALPAASLSGLSSAPAPEAAKKNRGVKKSSKGKKARARSR